VASTSSPISALRRYSKDPHSPHLNAYTPHENRVKDSDSLADFQKSSVFSIELISYNLSIALRELMLLNKAQKY